MHRAVELAVHGQVSAVVRILPGEILVDVDAEPGLVARIKRALGKRVRVREHAIGLFAVTHVLMILASTIFIRDRLPAVARERPRATGSRTCKCPRSSP